jgi:hypothetical protein
MLEIDTDLEPLVPMLGWCSRLPKDRILRPLVRFLERRLMALRMTAETASNSDRKIFQCLFPDHCSRIRTAVLTDFDRAVSNEEQFGGRMGLATSVTLFVDLAALNTISTVMIHGC